MIFSAIVKALGQLGDRRFQKVLWAGVAASIGLLAAFSWLMIKLLHWVLGDPITLPWIGQVSWLSGLIDWGMIPVMLGFSIILMVPVASAVSSLFLDEVAQAVEDEHYPSLPPATPVSFLDNVRDAVSFLGLVIVANIFALILYVVLAPFAAFIFWGLNGFLLGREYFTLAAIRRVGRVEAKRLRAKYPMRIWVAGILVAVPLSVPIVNLLVPILGAAMFTHIYHQLVGKLG